MIKIYIINMSGLNGSSIFIYILNHFILFMHYSLLEKYKINFLSDIIGQSYNISFLQNSFFKEVFYPLYIFSGMRGTGKTTSARLFSYGMQCSNLQNFKQDLNKNKIPCYDCYSCLLHKKREHPDLIEIDAASHSGIETIRAVIDNVYMLPVISKKKIYIIDEAHMLSKAAFNACLKIMEEPPENVHFLLATTELNKIIETVRSRSIILHYNPILLKDIEKYLEEICIKEEIAYDKEGLAIISKASEGSVRDALNLMNKLIIKCANITEEIVLNELGFIKEEIILLLLESMLTNNNNLYYDQKKYLSINKDIHKKKFFEDIVIKIQENIFLLKNNNHNNERLIKLHVLLDLFYQYEENFYLTNTFYGLIDIIFFKLNHKNTEPIIISPIPQDKQIEAPVKLKLENEKDSSSQNKACFILTKDNNNQNEQYDIAFHSGEEEKKKKFFSNLDKVLSTILQKGHFTICNQNQTVTIILKKNFTFYNNYFVQQENSIIKALQDSFGQNWKIKYNFTLIEEPHPFHEIKKKTEENNIDNTKKNILKENNIKINQNKKEYQVNNDLPDFINKINEIFPGKTYLYN